MNRFQSQRKQKYTMNLSTKQKQHLKGLAHPLKPVVMLGNNGLTEGVLAEIEQALGHHELIKVKIASEDRETKALIVLSSSSLIRFSSFLTARFGESLEHPPSEKGMTRSKRIRSREAEKYFRFIASSL